jgi:hypothetical protein
VLRVHVVIDGDQPHVLFREYDFRIEPDLQIIASEPAHVLDNDCGNLPGFHVLHHPGKRGPLKIRPGKPIVIDELIRGKSIFLGVPGEDFPLIDDAVGIALQFVLMAQSSIQVVDFIVRLSVQNILRFRQPTDGNVWLYYIMHYRGCLKNQEVLLGWWSVSYWISRATTAAGSRPFFSLKREDTIKVVLPIFRTVTRLLGMVFGISFAFEISCIQLSLLLLARLDE